MWVESMSRGRVGVGFFALLGVLLLALGFGPPADATGNHSKTWSFTQGGVEAKFYGAHYNTAYDNAHALTANVQATCQQRVRLTHSQLQMAWKVSVHPHTIVDQWGPYGTTRSRASISRGTA